MARKPNRSREPYPGRFTTPISAEPSPRLSLRGARQGDACRAKSPTEGSGERSRRISISALEWRRLLRFARNDIMGCSPQDNLEGFNQKRWRRPPPLLIITAPPCRVLLDFEPAIAGGILPVTFALAEAYRVAHRITNPIYQVLAQNLLLHHEHSRD